MAIRCGFFNSVDHDRLYTAEEMTEPYKGLISNGVLATPKGTPSDYLQVMASSGMEIVVKPGRGIFDGKWLENTADMPFSIPANTNVLPRIDSVIVRIDSRISVRSGDIILLPGIPASNPTPPTINDLPSVTDYRIANIRVEPSAAVISQSAITDKRGSEECPWATSLIQQVDTSTLFKQYEAAAAEMLSENDAEFNEWFQEAKDKINKVTAESLQNQIMDILAVLNKTVSADIRIPANGWSTTNGTEDYPYSIDVSVDAATESHFPLVSRHQSTASVFKAAGFSNDVQSLDGVLRFWARHIPSGDVLASVKLLGDSTMPKRLLYCAEEKGLLFNVYSDGDIQPAGETDPDSSVRTFENITVADNGGASLDTRSLPHLDIGISDIPGYSKGVKVSWSGANNDTGFPAIRVRLQEPTNEDAVGFTVCSKRNAALPIIVTLYACSSSLGTSIKEYGQYSVTLPNDGIAHHLRIPFSHFGITDGISLPGNASAVCFRISWNNAQSTDANGDMFWIDNVAFFSAEI